MCRMQFTRCIEFAEIRGSNTTPSREQTKRHHELKKAQIFFNISLWIKKYNSKNFLFVEKRKRLLKGQWFIRALQKSLLVT